MKTIIRLTIIGILFISQPSCKTPKKTPETSANIIPDQNTTASNTQQVNNSSATQARKETTVRLVVSFYSRGQGIDNNSKEEFVRFLNSYPKKIVYEPTKWGLEGEVDYCLGLNELSPVEQKDFIEKAKNILSKSKLVNVKENSKCDHVAHLAAPNSNADEDTYRLQASFYSKGEGIDLKINDEFVKFLDSYANKILYISNRVGREGEVEYCIKINELTSTEQDSFVKKAKKILQKSTLVHVNENVKCVHKH